MLFDCFGLNCIFMFFVSVPLEWAFVKECGDLPVFPAAIPKITSPSRPSLPNCSSLFYCRRKSFHLAIPPWIILRPGVSRIITLDAKFYSETKPSEKWANKSTENLKEKKLKKRIQIRNVLLAGQSICGNWTLYSFEAILKLIVLKLIEFNRRSYTTIAGDNLLTSVTHCFKWLFSLKLMYRLTLCNRKLSRVPFYKLPAIRNMTCSSWCYLKSELMRSQSCVQLPFIRCKYILNQYLLIATV